MKLLCFIGIFQCSLLSFTAGQSLQRLLDDLILNISATTTTIYYDVKQSAIAEDVLQRKTVPSIIINSEEANASSFELRNHFNSQILSVVFIRLPFVETLMETLKRVLHRWNEADILFIADDDDGIMDFEQRWIQLFDWCWENDFYNVLLVSSHGSSQLYQFSPFSRSRMIQTNLGYYLDNYHKWRNLHQYPLRVGIAHLAPKSIIYESRSDGPSFSGTLYYFVKLFADSHNATLVATVLPSGSECLEILQTKEVSICVHPMPYLIGSYSYEWAVVLYIQDFHLMVPYAKPMEKYKYFLLPFDSNIWIIIIVTVSFVGLAVSLLYRHELGIYDASSSFLTAFTILIYANFELPRSTLKAKYLLFALMIITGFIISNLYLAKLSSFLTTTVYEKEIESAQDVVDRNVTILISEYDKHPFESFDIPKEIWSQVRIVDEETRNHNRENLNPNYAYFAPLEVSEFLLYQQLLLSRGVMRITSETYIKLQITFPISLDWPLKSVYNEFILRLYSVGLYEGIQRKVEQEATKEGLLKMLKTEVEPDFKPLSPIDLYGAFIILAVGHIVSLIVFALERSVHYL